jgi:hypothetical protein
MRRAARARPLLRGFDEAQMLALLALDLVRAPEAITIWLHPMWRVNHVNAKERIQLGHIGVLHVQLANSQTQLWRKDALLARLCSHAVRNNVCLDARFMVAHPDRANVLVVWCGGGGCGSRSGGSVGHCVYGVS